MSENVTITTTDSLADVVAHPGLKRALRKRKELDKEKQKMIDVKRIKQDEEAKEQEESSRRRWERNYSSDDSGLREDNNNIQTYYCAYCLQPSLIIDCLLGELPLRKSDKARVMREDKHLYKRMMEEGETKLIKRAKGVEQQCRLVCKDCGLLLCYRPVPVGKKSKYCYFVDGGMVDNPNKAIKASDLDRD